MGKLVQLFFIPYALQGHWWAAAPMLILLQPIGLYSYRIGYRAGTKAAASLLSSGTLKTIMIFLAVLGFVHDWRNSFGLVCDYSVVFGVGEGAKHYNGFFDSDTLITAVLFVYFFRKIRQESN